MRLVALPAPLFGRVVRCALALHRSPIRSRPGRLRSRTLAARGAAAATVESWSAEEALWGRRTFFKATESHPEVRRLSGRDGSRGFSHLDPRRRLAAEESGGEGRQADRSAEQWVRPSELSTPRRVRPPEPGGRRGPATGQDGWRSGGRRSRCPKRGPRGTGPIELLAPGAHP
jgi:hypothetical protein